MPLSRKSVGKLGKPFHLVPWSGSAAGTWPTASAGIWIKFRLPRAQTFTGLRLMVVTPSGNAKVAVYADDAAAANTVLIASSLSGAIALASTAAGQDLLFGASQDLVAEQDYRAFIVVDNATASFLRIQAVAAGYVLPGTLDTAFTVGSVYTTPPSTQSLSGLSGPTNGYAPLVGLI